MVSVQNTSGKGANSFQNIMHQAGLESNLFNAKRQTPNEEDANAEIFKGLSESVMDNSATGAQRAIGSMLKGMESGARSSSILDRQKDLKSYENVMQYLSAVNETAQEKNQYYEALDQAKSRMMPQISAYSQAATKMDPQTRELSVRQMLDDWNRMTGEHLGYISVDGTNPYLVTVANDQLTQVIDMRTLFAPESLAEQDMALTLPQLQLQEQEKRAYRDAQIQNWEDQQQRGWANLSQRGQFHEPEQILKESSAKKAGQVQQAEIPKLDTTIQKTENSLKNIEEMLDLVEGNEDIFQSQLANLWLKEDQGAFSNAVKKLSRKIAPEKTKAITKLNKYLQEMVIDKASLFARPNMFIEKVGSKSVPNWMMTPEAFKDVLSHIKEEVTYTRDNARKQREQYAGNTGVGHTGVQAWGSAPEGRGVWVEDPQTGEAEYLSPQQAQIAIQRGGRAMTGRR